MEKIKPSLLNLAGEYRVCSELNKRGVFATITYGCHKGADIFAIDERSNRAIRIEVKTSQRKTFVTSITQKGLDRDPLPSDAPEFWVLVQVLPVGGGKFDERFFVLTHQEICKAQSEVNAEYAKAYTEKHGKGPDLTGGVDNVGVEHVERFEDQWSKLTDL